MKKIMTIFALSLILFAGNVKAEEQYCATLIERKSFVFNFLGSNKNLYIASLKDTSGNIQPAFCLDPGWSIDPATPNAYVRLRTGSSLVSSITNRMRIAYEYGRIANTKTEEGQFRYLTAQIAIWVEASNRGASETTFINKFESAMSAAVASYFTGSGKSQDEINQLSKTWRESFINRLRSNIKYSGTLYVFGYKNGGRYQNFLTGLPGNVCPNDTVVKDPDKTYCPSPNDSIDITACINSGKEYAECVSENCPNTNTCPDGYGVKVVGNPPVCVNDNQMTTAKYHTEMDTSVCGTTIEEGTLETPVGQYCNLYCKEEVYVNYPGGISSPISLGTSIVWPTSTATEHTVWKNLYSLSYRGYKTCVLKIKNEQKVREDYNTFVTFINSHRDKYENNRTNNSCALTYQPVIDQANENLKNVQTTKQQVENVYNEANKAYQAAAGQCSTATREYEQSTEKTQCDIATNKVNGFNANKQAQYIQEHGTVEGMAQFERDKKDAIDNQHYWCNNRAAAKKNAMDNACANSNSKKTVLDNAKNALNAATQDVKNAETNLKNAQSELDNCYNYIKYYNYASNIIEELNTCANYSISPEDFYQFTSDTSISYDDNEYGATYSLNGNTQYACDGCSAEYHYEFDKSGCNDENCLTKLLNTIGERTISVTALTTYSLPDNIYRYVSKKDNKPLVSPIGDVIDVGYSFLPTSYNAKVGKLYNLNIIVNSLGENGKFTQLAQSKSYTCNYSVMNAPSDECVCPDGTEHAGEDLYPIIYNASTSANPMTCADAQLKYCNATVETYCPSDQTINITDCLKNSSFQHCVSTLCPNGSGDKFCPNDSSIKITACLNNGNSYDYCVNAICSNNVDYHCPKGTFNDGMDIKPCVFANINMGLEAALQYCKDTVCPGGQRIIYRTISLRNPFPGKTAGAGVSYTTNKFSLDPHLGRYPGSNWNSELLVKNQILYNRNVEGNAVYQKEPLYTFILDTNTIKEIRKYNDSQEKVGGYADFTLECNSNGVACLSNQFLRESISGLIGGVCSSGAKSDFYGCAES